MIDALLFAVRDAVRTAGFGYNPNNCDIQPDGHPPPGCGEYYLSIHQMASRSNQDNALNELFGFNLTLTARVSVPPDRVGDKLLASKLARRAGPTGQPSFNARCDQLHTFLHMDWGVLQDANTLLVALLPDAGTVYGFVEPARYRGMDVPSLKGGEWFSAALDAEDVGLVAELRFEDCRRMQGIATFS